MKFAFKSNKFWLFGPALGLIVASMVAPVFTLRDWIQNLGGIFRDATGSHWNFVYNTAVSWVFPTLFLTTTTISLVQALFIGVVWAGKNHRFKSS